MQSVLHWEKIYSTKTIEGTSWYQEHATRSLSLIRSTGIKKEAAIIDVGAGASSLAGDLIEAGYSDITVLDISGTALVAAQKRMGSRAILVNWMEADVTRAILPHHRFDVWHDRAVFHFLTEPEDRHAYVERVLHAVKPGGHVIIATFAEDGPDRCSGLPVMRYRPEELHREFGAAFVLLHHEKEAHRTPAGAIQQFTYCYCRKAA